MEFTQTTTLGVFLAVIVVGIGGLLGAGVMATNTVLMMVAPAMVVFGLLMLGLGVKHGEYRASQ
ncbi:DUF7333 family protein [Natronomonas sp. EA1]|uniref:DUF7333 family protein n=1 Tax=Natronomonas sp. EA1 TaxID=3421655 RepID=UPI003EBBCA20